MTVSSVPPTVLSDEQNRNILATIAELVKDRLALVAHFRRQKDFAAIYDCESHAFEKIAKYLVYYMPELQPAEPDPPTQDQANPDPSSFKKKARKQRNAKLKA